MSTITENSFHTNAEYLSKARKALEQMKQLEASYELYTKTFKRAIVSVKNEERLKEYQKIY